jgi:protein-S-isoprenylcysteine O-methyltransferase Ste14
MDGPSSSQLVSLIQATAVVGGLVVILAPMVQVLMNRRRPIEKTTGAAKWSRRWPAAWLGSAFLVGIGVLLWRPLPLGLEPSMTLVLVILGAACYFPAIIFYLWGLRTLASEFSVSTAAGSDLYWGHQLVSSGPFALCRHPMYLSVLLAAPGALLVFRTWAMLLFCPLSVVVVRRANLEEDLLRQAFGHQWDRYARRVPKWIPRIGASG